MYPTGDTLCMPPALWRSVVWGPWRAPCCWLGEHQETPAQTPPFSTPRTESSLHEEANPTQGLTWRQTSRPQPRLSETMRVMMVLRTVARNVLIPKTRAQSSLEREDAI